ncbi:MAG: glycosyltransferase [Planctomycetes bacterium]|nr:glycosyltransferase [Planctomycetota bacterium]MBI3844628.1 glycosyltransferase [Planctomycetota bacterium]
MWLELVAAGICATWTFNLARGLRAARATPTIIPESPKPGEVFPPLSIIVAARDEESGIRKVVDSLLAQEYPDFEVIVADDRSQDATPRILADIARRDGRLRILRIEALPEGWIGKSHANAMAAASASGELLLFTDGDVVHERASTASAVRELERRQLELLSPLPRIERGVLAESIVLPVFAALITMRYPAHRVNDPKKPTALAAGGFLLVSRRAYDSVGGHSAIRGEMIDDVTLATRLKSAGCRIAIANGCRLARTRMYESTADLWEGMTKSAFAGVGRRVGVAFLASAWIVILGIGAVTALTIGLATGNRLAAGLAAVALGMQLLYHLELQRVLGHPRLFALATPLGYVFYATGLVASALRTRFGRGVTWKGTRYR